MQITEPDEIIEKNIQNRSTFYYTQFKSPGRSLHPKVTLEHKVRDLESKYE